MAFPIGVVLVPEHGAAIVCGFKEGLVVKELDIGPDQILGDIEDTRVVEQVAEGQTAFAHLHDLQHLFVRREFFLQIVRVADGQIAKAVARARLGKYAVVLAAQYLEGVGVEQGANGEKAARAKRIDLLGTEGFGGLCICFRHGFFSQD